MYCTPALIKPMMPFTASNNTSTMSSSSHRSSNARVLPWILLLPLLLVSLSLPPIATATDPHPPSKSKPIVAHLGKDAATSLYTISINNNGAARLVVDLAGPLLWSTTCPSPHRTIPCSSSVCKIANRNRPAGCPYAGRGGDRRRRCACAAYPYNPVSGHCGRGDVTAVQLAANATDGKNPLFPVSFSAFATCAPTSLVEKLPAGVVGVAGMSRLPLSLPSQVASSLNVARQFALCLPTSGGGGDGGAAIFGGGPFQLLAGPPVELASGLRRDAFPLLKNPSNGGYYIRVTGIAVNLEAVPISPRALDLDVRRGEGGVTLSTVTPYTTLRRDVYRALVQAFDAATSGIPRAAAVRPFEMCYQASALGTTRLGFAVANIDLMLGPGRNWTLPGGSSLVQVNEQTVCFAFVEMGNSMPAVADSPAVVIGGFQMENNLLLFDVEKGTLGISSLLSGMRTGCGAFNFTMGSS